LKILSPTKAPINQNAPSRKHDIGTRMFLDRVDETGMFKKIVDKITKV